MQYGNSKLLLLFCRHNICFLKQTVLISMLKNLAAIFCLQFEVLACDHQFDMNFEDSVNQLRRKINAPPHLH